MARVTIGFSPRTTAPDRGWAASGRGTIDRPVGQPHLVEEVERSSC